MQAHRAKGGELAQLHAVQPLVGAGRHAHAALTALPRGDHHAGLAVRQVLLLQGTCTAGFFALAAGKALVGETGQIAAVVQGIVRHGGLELPGALVQQQAEVCTAVLVAAEAGQHAQQLFGAALGAVAHLLEHLAAGELLDVVGGFVRLIGQREAGLKHRFPEELHQAGQLGPQLVGAGVVLALAAGGQVQHDLFVQGQIGQRLPGKGRDAGAHHGVFAGRLLTADPDGIVVGVGGRGVALHLLRRGGDAAAAAYGDAQTAVGAGVPVLDEVGTGKNLIAVGADILAGRAGFAVRVQVPALAAVDLRMGGLHQCIHRSSCKKAHTITPFLRST